MNGQRRVVVGIDGSEAARAALRWAWQETELHKGVLEVLHSWRQPVIGVPDAYPADLVEAGRMADAARTLIDREIAALGLDSSAITVEREATDWGTARALVDASKRADLVVLGRTGTSGVAHELVGPKVVQVAHHAACPVAVVPNRWEGGGRGVIVGVDGSAHAQKALRWAGKEAIARGTGLTAVLAWGLLDQHHVGGGNDFDPAYNSADALGALEEMVGEGLETVEPSPVRKEVPNDLPAHALLELAHGAELLVVGARGFGGFRDLMLGSVSHRCLVHAPCPTVVVRSARGAD
jgi:nucleotide-binding universal stress UspA family protein